MTLMRKTSIAPLALVICSCGVSNSDPSLWQQSKDLGGAQFQPGGQGAAGEPATGGGGGDQTAQPPENGAGGASQGTGAVPAQGAGGMLMGSSGGMGNFPPTPGAGGFPTGAAGMQSGAGGFFQGSGGMQTIGAGGMQTTGAGGMQVAGPPQKCTFSFDVTTVTAHGLYAPRNVGAIWITDAQNKFVKTLRVWGTIRLGNATAWTTVSGNNTTDAVTGATRSGHGALNAKWDCTNVSRTAVADGDYTVHVTFAESDANPFFGGTAIQASVNFTKSAAGADVMGTDTANFTSMHASLTIP